MNYKILTLDDKQEWNRWFDLLPVEQQDVYYRPEYYQLYEENGDGKTECFVYEDDGKIALYPYLVNSVNELGYELDDEYFDIQGAYGYNGVVCNCYGKDFIDNFFTIFSEYCLKKKIIAEFTRYNPILENHKFESRFEPIYVLDNVYIDLNRDLEDIWMNSFTHRVRGSIKKSQKHNHNFITVKGSDINEKQINDFIYVYQTTMQKNDANNFYYFSKEYFQKMVDLLGEYLLFCFVEYQGKVVSVELIFINKVNSYSYLGGTLADYYKLAPNSFMRYEVTKKLKEDGFQNNCLGGGLTFNDSIYNYKKSFSRDIESKFYIGKMLHNKGVYNNVIEQWIKRTRNTENNKLLKYRDI